jgi:phage tail sheath protein FI
MNNNQGSQTNGSLISGSADNVRWQIVSPDTASGTFTLLIRQGNDTTTNPNVLESFTNVSLDPNQANYIEAVVGNYSQTVAYDSSTGQYYIQNSGSYANASRYVRVKEVLTPTYNYFTNNGVAKTQYYNSIPTVGSGSFGGATGNDLDYTTNLYQNISTVTQGLVASDYTIVDDILANPDEYNFQLISAPGITQQYHSTVVSQYITMAEERGDCFYITDLTGYGATINTPGILANQLNTNYAAAYWPWVQVLSAATGKLVWVPASTVMPGVYAFNDRVSAEWFAPAGLNRGGVAGALQAERKLGTNDRDTLYQNKVNPIASFPGVGLVAYGQKTLQTKASALDRINVRRLLINLKRYVRVVAESLLFEQNTLTTRNNFVSQVNPYMESVQQRQGLYAYKVVMDDSNNTPDVIDRNQLVGAIYIQPAKTVEFIYITFNITPTGVTFGA